MKRRIGIFYLPQNLVFDNYKTVSKLLVELGFVPMRV